MDVIFQLNFKKSFPDIRLKDFFRFDVKKSLLNSAQACEILSNKSAAFASPGNPINGNFKASQFCRFLDQFTRRVKSIRVSGVPLYMEIIM